FFLEMNTRLQVEHPVTELVTGIDLVEQQLRIAEGRSLTLRQPDIDDALARGGHAIEVRLYAEDAEAGFLPATGRVERLAWPVGDGIRVDAGIDEGDEIGGHFDPMLAKIVAHGRDRGEALERLATGLDRTVGVGGGAGPGLARRGDTVFVDVAGRSTPFRLAPPPDVDRAARVAATQHGGAAEIVAPMPGAVIAVHRNVGDVVDAGEPVITLEEMKMEHAVLAPSAGTFTEHSDRAGVNV